MSLFMLTTYFTVSMCELLGRVEAVTVIQQKIHGAVNCRNTARTDKSRDISARKLIEYESPDDRSPISKYRLNLLSSPPRPDGL